MYWCCFAGKLGASVEVVQRGVEGLMYLMTESSKCMVSLSPTLTRHFVLDWIVAKDYKVPYSNPSFIARDAF